MSFAKKLERSLGCQKKHQPTPEDRERILALYGQGYGQVRVAKLTRIPQPWVRKTLRAAGVDLHPTGARPFEMESRQFAKFRADVVAQSNFCKDLAERCALTKGPSLRIAKEIRGVKKFYRGKMFPPLSSPWPPRRVD